MDDSALDDAPIAGPRSDDELLDWLRLIRSRRVGAATFYRLLRECGSAGAALRDLPCIAQDAGVADYRPCPEGVAMAELRAGHLAGARLVARGTSDYPRALNDLSDAPPLLWAIGDLSLSGRPAVALVGARNASSLGTRMARALATGIGEAGSVVVSGLARGIDTAAHMAALPTGTIAVMAGGVDVIYPAENAALGQEIGESGLRLSEQPMGLQPQARHFPRRNRIIAGLARAVVVVEAAAKSGSLITARDALDQGREVLAVPGHPFDARAAGCNMLIRDGATLVRGTRDVLDAIAGAPNRDAADTDDRPRRAMHATGAAPQASARAVASPPVDGHGPTEGPAARTLQQVQALHRRILSRLGPSPTAEDQLIRDLRLPAGVVTPQLVTLELDGRIERRPGGLLSRRD